MALRTKEEIESRIRELEKDEHKFYEFLRDMYGDEECKDKIEQHTWRIRREIEILRWVIDEDLPF